MGRAFHHTGDVVAGWPVNLNPSGGYTGWVCSSPACADFDRDGDDEVAIGVDDHKLYLLQGDGTSYLPGVWPLALPFGFRASPALGDLDNDGELDIVIGHRTDSGDLRLRAYRHDGQPVAGWPVVQAAGFGGYTFGWLSPLLADLGGDEIPEVIAVKERSVPDPDRAEIYAFSPHAIPVPGFPLTLEGLAYGMPTICDLDDDGLGEILIGDLTNRLHRFDLTFSFDPERERQEWHRLQYDLAHTGRWMGYPSCAIGEPLVLAPAVTEAVAAPNPFTSRVELRMMSAASDAAIPRLAGDDLVWRVFDAQGRLVCRLHGEADAGRVVWHGELAGGRPAPAGVYFARPPAARGTVTIVKLER
jgi:hypothetical protein